MPTPSEITAQMRQALSQVEPELDTSVGTPIRKVLDVVAEALSEAYLDRYLINYQYDIDARSGADLDAFVALFGFARLTARRATGTVVLQRDTPASAGFFIPSGTQISTTSTPPTVVQTVTNALFPAGSTSISVPAQAVVGGVAGNLAANTLIRWLSPVEGVIAVTNPAPFTGGADAESDDELRTRFKRTVFRNLSGTEDNYLGIALNDPDVVNAIVLGPSERWTEQIEVVSGTATSLLSNGTATLSASNATNATPIVVTTTKAHHLFPGDIVNISGITGNTAANGTWRVKTTPTTTTFSIENLDGSGDSSGNGAYSAGGDIIVVTRAKWVYPRSYAFGPNLTNGELLVPDVHYTLDTTTIPPVVTSIDPDMCPDGIYDLSVLYVPLSSRNDPPVGIANRVDVYCSGSRIRVASETVLGDGRVQILSTPGGTLGYNRWRRDDGQFPTAGNVFVRLSFVPIIDLPDEITIGSDTLTLGTDYWLISEYGSNRGAWDSVSGIEIDAAAVEAGAMNIASSTNASPIVVTTATNHAFKVGQKVIVENHATNTAANGVWTVQSVGADTVTLLDSTGNGVGGATGTISLYSPISLEYTYNAVPRDVQAAIEGWRLITTDVSTHEGIEIPLKVYAALILRPGFTEAAVQAAIDTHVDEFLSGLGFGGLLQVSDLLNVIGDVEGVDSVRFLNASDMTPLSVSGATNATPIVLTVPSNHGVVAGDLVVIEGVGGNTAANGIWVVDAVGGTTVTLRGSEGNAAYTTGGTLTPAKYALVRMEEDGATPKTVYHSSSTPHRAMDVQAEDTEVFSRHSVVLSVKAQNTFGVV